MHELLKHVLTERDLTRAGDIFAIPDADIVDDLNEVLKQITDISSRPDYCRNDRDQALIEICVARVTSCVKETGTLDKYCGALVALLESCLHHNLMPLGHLRDDDPPHAKIASDIIACIVLSDKENYGNKSVMELFLPVSPEPLEGHTPALVSLLPHAEPVEKSSLFALFEQIAARKPEALKTCVPQLLSYLCPHTASQSDPGCMCVDILQVIASLSRSRVTLVVDQGPAVKRAARAPHASPQAVTLVANILTQLGYTSRELAQEALNFVVERLGSAPRALQAALLRDATSLCSAFPALFTDNLLTAVRANTSNRPKSGSSQSEVNRTSTGVTIVRLGGGQTPAGASNTGGSGSTGGVGNGTGSTTGSSTGAVAGTTPSAGGAAGGGGGYARRAKLGDSRSTGRLHPGPAPHRSMTRLNVPGGSVGGLHKSMTRLSSSQQINTPPNGTTGTVANSKPSSSSSGVVGKANGGSGGNTNGASGVNGTSGAITVTSVCAARAPRPAPRPHHHHNILIGSIAGPNQNQTIISGPPLSTQSISVNPLTPGKSSDGLTPITSAVSIQHSNTALGNVSVVTSSTPGSGPISVSPTNPISISGPVTVTSRRANNTSVTMINTNNGTNNTSASNHRISVFEPYPMRDTVQHFCEKHLDKIKAYMDNVSLRLPPPAKCTIEERRSKKQARLMFVCGRRGAHCLYARCMFSVRTRLPRVWIHLMFLALQARHPSALSSRDPTVASLKHCWDILKCENKTFLTLVTGAFPGIKEQEMLLNELRAAGFFDVFEVVARRNDGAALPPTQATWGCFLCTHPERAVGFLAADGAPVIEGQLKEKKGRWRLFRRWRTRYFTLSGAHLSCKGSSGGESIDINQIRSVKVSRGARNIPKAFEIFTGDQTLILKPKDGKNAEEWVQCLSIAVAHSQARDAPAKANSLPARGLTLKSF
ncbi:hypothetical protein HW555_006214 [Spodoptera exigua]|uniref:PH domain-containing protein n=1 Tax=Spodoptera exigua TaxID=7107 RepID=A0A835L4R5_SPOEX|nr:hypothetical protein HW555_006214 [Spodoptera exigua]